MISNLHMGITNRNKGFLLYIYIIVYYCTCCNQTTEPQKTGEQTICSCNCVVEERNNIKLVTSVLQVTVESKDADFSF